MNIEIPQTPAVNGTATASRPPVLVGNRTLTSWKMTPTKPLTTRLEDVRDRLAAIHKLQEPRDLDRSFSQMHVSFTGGRVTARMMGPGGMEGDEMLVSDNAFRQMATTLLPTRFGSGLLEQSALGEMGEKLSTMSYALFAKGNTTPRMFRVANIKDPYSGRVMPCIRGQLSQGYGTYDNLTFVQDLLDNAPELAEAPVLDFYTTDVGLRLRFAMEPMDRIELNKPVSMLEAWNSEVGRRRCGLSAGAWKLVCTNGMTHWDARQEFGWYHRGSGDRIRDGVRSAVNEIKTTASGVVEAYGQALEIAVDDAFGWMEAELKREKLSGTQIQAVHKALTHETTTPGGVLASLVDATTLAAQGYDLFEQASMERAASRMMRRGASIALKNNGRIPAMA